MSYNNKLVIVDVLQIGIKIVMWRFCNLHALINFLSHRATLAKYFRLKFLFESFLVWFRVEGDSIAGWGQSKESVDKAQRYEITED